jgi:hypothetical protein
MIETSFLFQEYITKKIVLKEPHKSTLSALTN